MFQENEIITLFLSAGIVVFIQINRRRLRALPSWQLLLDGYYVLVCASLFTVLEGVLWGAFFNFLEHLSIGLSAVLLAIWCWRVFHLNRAGT